MNATPGKTSWVVAPADLCILCRKPLTRDDERSAWNDHPAHAECVRIHTLQRHPVFRDWVETEGDSEEDEPGAPHEDDDEDENWPG